MCLNITGTNSSVYGGGSVGPLAEGDNNWLLGEGVIWRAEIMDIGSGVAVVSALTYRYI